MLFVKLNFYNFKLKVNNPKISQEGDKMQYIKSKKVLLKNHPVLNEKWLQEQIAESPEILGLGENLEWRDSERKQPTGGKLDLLFADSESGKRFTVELQLGECDPDHIIRTIEYWDIERKRFPQFEHCAVIVAENITSRFWNIINLFNRNIPLIAIQLDVRQIEDKFTLNFIKVLDEIEYGTEEEETSEPTDRAYWENRSTPEVLSIVDSLKTTLNKFFPDIELNYNKYYIGLKKNNMSDNFLLFKPYKKFFDIRVRKNNVSEETVIKMENAGLILDWKEPQHKRYRIRLSNNKNDLDNEKMSAIETLFKEAGGFKEDIKEVA